MSKLNLILAENNFTKEQFIRERRKHLDKKGLSANRIYQTERSWSKLNKITLKGWQEHVLFLGGFAMVPAIVYLNINAIAISIPLLMWILLFIKVGGRRSKMWTERYAYLKKIENKRLEIEWMKYKKSGEIFSPDIVSPSNLVLKYNPNFNISKLKNNSP